MTWNNIVDGDSGIASTAMQNWRHAGRMAFSSFYPMDTNGAYAVQDFGETGKEWGDVYLASGKKIYVGGVEFQGGGAGSGLDVVALANAFDKQGNNYPLPTDKILRNAFTSDQKVLCYLRDSYNTADTTTIVMDHGLDSELETINDMETVGDFTTGTSSPTVAANTTDFLEGTQSVQFTASSLNGSADMYETVELSLTDRDFRVSVYPDTLSNVTDVYVILYTSSGNQRQFDFDVSDLTATTWNHLTCDLNLDTGTTNGVTVTDTGTFVRSDITRIYYGITTSSTQTVVPSFDLARAISDQPLLVPDYGLTLTIQDATNQDVFTVIDETETDYTTLGTYTINATLGHNYTNDETACFISNTSGTISNNQLTHDSTASGDQAKTAKQIDVKYLNQTVSTASLEAFVRFYHEPYEVTEFPSTSSIKVSSATDKSAYFLDNDYILLYKKLRGGRLQQSMEGSHSVNYLRLQLNADATYSSNEITLNHDGTNAIGADSTGYYVIPETVLFEYIAGSKTASTLTQATPTEFLLTSGNEFIFEDTFNRSDSATVGNGWYEYNENRYGVQIEGNRLRCEERTNASLSRGQVSRNDFNFSLSPFTKYEIYLQDVYINTGSTSSDCCFLVSVGSDGVTSDQQIGTADGAYANSGLGVSFQFDDTANLIIINFTSNGEYIGTTYQDGSEWGGGSGATYEVKIEIEYPNIRAKVWQEGNTEPINWQNTHTVTNEISVKGSALSLFLVAYRDTGGADTSIGNIIVEKSIQGYTYKFSEDVTNVDKLETITTLDRNDTTNQDPVIYETGSILV